MANVTKSIAMFFREGSSDKEYRIQIEDEGNGKFTVNAFFGRRGGNLKIAPQGNGFDLPTAEKIFTSVVNGKTKKGYKPDGNTEAAILDGVRKPEDTGLRAQLLNPITESEAEKYLTDDAWVMEEKFDGERLMVEKKAVRDTPIFANRKGQSTNVPREIEDVIKHMPSSFVLDGENVSGTFYVFDVLSSNEEDVSTLPYIERIKIRSKILDHANGNVKEVKTYIGTKEKKEAFSIMKERGAEGVVFKKADSKYSAGRPASGGSQIKLKFWKSASCIVANHNDKSSIGLEMFENGRRVYVGNVTVKLNQTKPPIESVCEVKYLYVVAKGGSLVQPELLGIRHDISPEECTTNQIEYKGAGDA